LTANAFRFFSFKGKNHYVDVSRSEVIILRIMRNVIYLFFLGWGLEIGYISDHTLPNHKGVKNHMLNIS
jgi:hypothetical protein